jgi:hypothetical protein
MRFILAQIGFHNLYFWYKKYLLLHILLANLQGVWEQQFGNLWLRIMMEERRKMVRSLLMGSEY